jgi:hypothetical protein
MYIYTHTYLYVHTGIGKKTVDILANYAGECGISMSQALDTCIHTHAYIYTPYIGIGKKTVDILANYAGECGISVSQALDRISEMDENKDAGDASPGMVYVFMYVTLCVCMCVCV